MRFRGFCLIVLLQIWCTDAARRTVGALRSKSLSDAVQDHRDVASSALGESSVKWRCRTPWPLFNDSNGLEPLCGGMPIAKLMDVASDVGAGRLGLSTSAGPSGFPDCPAPDGGGTQSGGHAGSILFLPNGRIGKLTRAFDDPAQKDIRKSHVTTGQVEYHAYMEMWCLKRLESIDVEWISPSLRVLGLQPNVSDIIKTHLLRPFVFGSDPWAPDFFGFCHSNGGAYMVLENMGKDFVKSCTLDLKLGYSTVEPNEGKMKWLKLAARDKFLSTAQVEGASLAGFNIWNPLTQQEEKMKSKLFGPATPVDEVFDKYFDTPLHRKDKDLFLVWRQRLLDMGVWWGSVGTTQLRAVALSVLMMYECDPDTVSKAGGGALPARMKLIDYAHFYPYPSLHTDSWPIDGVHKGIMVSVGQLDRKLAEAGRPAPMHHERRRTDLKGVTCPKGDDRLFLQMSTCKEYGAARKKNFAAWHPLNKGDYQWNEAVRTGECRVCGNATKKSRRVWLVFQTKTSITL